MFLIVLFIVLPLACLLAFVWGFASRVRWAPRKPTALNLPVTDEDRRIADFHNGYSDGYAGLPPKYDNVFDPAEYGTGHQQGCYDRRQDAHFIGD